RVVCRLLTEPWNSTKQMNCTMKQAIKIGFCTIVVVAVVGLIYLQASYSYYARLVDRTLKAGAFADTIDIYASSMSPEGESELITNLSNENREKRRLVRFDEIPATLVHAVLAIEDKRFFEHSGLDFRRMAKAAYVNLTTGQKRQGASTISMQLARSL